MNFYCCGVKYSTTDPDTYLNIEKYQTKKLLKTSVRKKKVHHEDIYFLHCKKNDCIKTFIKRYSTKTSITKGHLETEEISRRKASLEFKAKNLKNMKYISIPTPMLKLVPQSKTIPFVYGKVEDPTTQRRRYVNETGYADYEWIEQPVKIISSIL